MQVTFYYCNVRSWASFQHPDTLLFIQPCERGKTRVTNS